jgi:haloacetate dehalogenase
MRIPGFEYQRIPGADGVTLNVATAGDGEAVLLLHGFPETHLAWRHLGPRLARRWRVVCPDLRGYGESDRPAEPRQVAYAKRTMAADAVALMERLGHRRFSIVGHDRGALVAFRAGLDHPERVERLAVMDVLPAADMWDALAGPGGVFAFHLYFLAQESDLPERMIAADPDTFFGHFLDRWVAVRGAIPPAVREVYLASFRRPEAIHAVCEDYRASAFVDPGHDRADRRAGRRLEMPVLALWQDPGGRQLPFDPRAIWQSWAPRLETAALACGHFLPEERPDEVAAAIERHLAG